MAEVREFDVRPTLGAFLVGTLITCGLFGISNGQMYIYARRYPRDKLYLKAMVAVVWFFELGHSVCISNALYVLSVNHFGNPSSLKIAPKSLSTSVIFKGIIATIVQVFFANRVRIVCGRRLIPTICFILSMAHVAFYMLTCIMAIRMTSLFQFMTEWKWLIVTVFTISFSIDLIVVATLSYYLRNSKFVDREKKIAVLDKLIAWTIQNGLVTMVIEVILLFLFLKTPGNYIWLALLDLLPMMFSFPLMASLNGRTNGQETVIELAKMTPDSNQNSLLSESKISVSVDGLTEGINNGKEKFLHDGTYFPNMRPQDTNGRI